MTDRESSSFVRWYKEGHLSPYVRTLKSHGGILNLAEALQPAGDMSSPAMPDLILGQELLGGRRVTGNLGGGNFRAVSEKGGFFLAAPNFANSCVVDTCHQIRSLSFPLKQWQHVLDEAAHGEFSFDRFKFYGGTFNSPVIRSALQNLWTLCDEEGAPSRLLARAAGCEIMAELCRMAGTPLSVSKGGLAPWAKRRCIEMLRARLSEDISLDELSAEVRLSPYHFSRMFKQSFGVPPRVYLTQLRVEKACDLLELTDASITAIAMDVGYSSNQVLARVFTKHRYMSPTDYRRAVRDPTRSIAV
ncbi:AraC family transcriptional regulator [Paracoccus liaowanqingii]|uniref:AraC family transcriptional regulator n=1 Tax=Paracoccus liaowanqingii TaxID=2560053 RepID=A0A4Z1C1G1_9RHOB|nr:AraC family transcriptional regulator [Paracoccus liaowanqingii]TGN55944.1 AraC family transcriptional regulator [Paracoccus liaowanqingii]